MLAHNIAIDWDTGYGRPVRGTATPRAITSAHLIRIAFDAFIEQCMDGTLRRRSRDTIQNYRSTFQRLLTLTGITFLHDATDTRLRGFLRIGAEQYGWMPRTSVSHHKNLRPFFHWCVERGFLARNPMDTVLAPEVLRSLPDFYTDREVQCIVNHIDASFANPFENARNKAMVGTMILTGLRKGELLALRTSDISLEDDVIRVRAETAKNRAPRAIKINSVLRGLLVSYATLRRKRQTHLASFWLSANRASGFTAHGLKHLLNRISRDLGFRVRAHKMRHTFATKFYQGSKDIVSLGQILGHADISTTMIYTHLLPETTAVSMEMNPLNSIF